MNDSRDPSAETFDSAFSRLVCWEALASLINVMI